jgi:hypothetical protein
MVVDCAITGAVMVMKAAVRITTLRLDASMKSFLVVATPRAAARHRLGSRPPASGARALTCAVVAPFAEQNHM